MSEYHADCIEYLMAKGRSHEAALELIAFVEAALHPLFDKWLGEHPVQLALGDKSRNSAPQRRVSTPGVVKCDQSKLTHEFKRRARPLSGDDDQQ